MRYGITLRQINDISINYAIYSEISCSTHYYGSLYIYFLHKMWNTILAIFFRLFFFVNYQYILAIKRVFFI